MYDDLARAQNPTPLEWFVVHAVIPSLALTLLMHTPSGDDCERGFQFSPQSSTGSDTMRAFSSVASITLHVGLGAAVLFGTAKAGRSDPTPPIERPIVFQPAPVEKGGGGSVPAPITV